MYDPWRWACPDCGSRQVRRGRHGTYCEYDRCPTRQIDPVDLRADDLDDR